MNELVRHKTLLVLSSRIADICSALGSSLPKKKDDALQDTLLCSYDIYDSSMPLTMYFDETVEECLRSINDDDYQVLKAYVSAKMNSTVDISTVDNIAFSGGGGKGVAYNGIIQYLSRIPQIAYDPDALSKSLLLRHKIDLAGTPLAHMTKISPRRLQDELEDLFIANGKGALEAHLYQADVADEGIFETQTALDGVTAVSGTSAGAITALPIALGMGSDEYNRIATDSQFNHFFINTQQSFDFAFSPFIKGGYDKTYIQKYSEIYVDELTKQLDGIVPMSDDFDSSIIKNIFVRSMVSDPSPNRIDHLFDSAKNSGILDATFDSANKRMNDILKGTRRASLRASYDDFQSRGGFKQSTGNGTGQSYMTPAQEAFYVSLYTHHGTDIIQNYFGSLLRHKMETIGMDSMIKALPDHYHDASIKTPRIAMRLITMAGNSLNENNIAPSSENIAQSIGFMTTLTRKETRSMKQIPNEMCIDETIAKYKKLYGEEISREDANYANRLVDTYLLDASTEASQSLEMIYESSIDPDSIDLGAITSQYLSCHNVIEDIFLDKCAEMNFKDLHRLKEAVPEAGIKDLHLTATEAGIWPVLKSAYYSHESNPNMPIRDAVRASMSLPLVFKPTKSLSGKRLYDGGIMENTPDAPFRDQRNTIIAMAEDRSFYEFSGGIIQSWNKGIVKGLMYHLNEFRKNYSVSDSLKSIFVSSIDHKTLNFTFKSEDLLKINDFNSGLITDDPEIDKDGYYSFLAHRMKHLGIEVDKEDFAPIRSGIFSSGDYGKNMLQMSIKEDEIYGHGL